MLFSFRKSAVLKLLVGVLVSVGVQAHAQSPAAKSTTSADADSRCERLAKLNLPSASVALAQKIAAGTFSGPPQVFTGRDLSAFYKTVPAFCRVRLDAKPSADSDIKIEVWLPLTNWTGRLQAIGNGGFAGLIDYYQIAEAMSKGYVSTTTDAGHAASLPIDASWAPGHPEKVADFGYRAVHVMTQLARAVAKAFYGSEPKHSYFAGCSDGGREALMEAQRFPADYDGILAGAPANDWTALLSMAVADTQALTSEPANFIPPAKISLIASAVREQCDKLDGVSDGILNDPRQCRFDPTNLQCKGADSENCLTGQQVSALKVIYAGLRNSSGRGIFPGYLPGAEEGPGGWGIWITGPVPTRSLIAFFGLGYFSNMVYEKPDWNYKTFNVDSGLKDAKEKTAAVLDATNPDLKPFAARRGKLILYHGWNDPAIPALSTINYLQSVQAKMGQRSTSSFLRLYMVPGMQHCWGGPGPDDFGQVGTWRLTDPQHSIRVALEQWVENSEAPSQIVATKFAGDPDSPAAQPTMTRPLCPFPEVAKYKGSGDTNDASNFVCSSSAK
jgi:Tannase and feruloyl esterase